MSSPDNKDFFRSRAQQLFMAEARAQDLAALALQKSQPSSKSADVPTLPESGNGLASLVCNSDLGILEVQQRLYQAKFNAAQMQASDKELNDLYRSIYGWGEEDVDGVIEGEVGKENPDKS